VENLKTSRTVQQKSCLQFVLILTLTFSRRHGNQNNNKESRRFVLGLTLKTEGRFDLDFGVSKQQQRSATVVSSRSRCNSCIKSSVCLDFVPSRGSPGDLQPSAT
jgi:hypothetical protein